MRFYKILQAKQCGNAEGLTAYERQFVEYLKKIDIKTITGVLPLSFTAKGGTAADWVIYGNDENGTENLVESIEQGTWIVTGFVKLDATTRCRVGNIIDVVGGQQYTMYLECPSHNGRLNIQFKNDAGTSKGETGWKNVGESGSYTATIPLYVTKITIILSIDEGSGKCSPANFTNVMLIKGSTAPDHYIPYQKGVGERTENLWDNDDIVTGGINTITGQPENNENFKRTDNYIPVDPDESYYLNGMTGGLRIFQYDANKGFTTSFLRTSAGAFSLDASTRYIKISGQSIGFTNVIMLVKGSIAPTTYIPYGYQIPLTISQQGEQSDKTYDIYIGDSPLTEGETVSKTSTGVDIELFNGENTVSTTLYNKPAMEIKYK